MSDTIAGKYRVISELGEGAYSKVYLVEHCDLGVKYALKILLSSMSSEEKFLQRFRREAAVLQRFSHPGSVQLRDFGRTEDGHYYMAMDYCEGVSLKEFIEKQAPVSLTDATQLILQLLDAIGAAHRQGIIHRDLKPDNIFVHKQESGALDARILDFGVAKITEELDTNATRTQEGASIGTPSYMSPEQAAGEGQLDHRVDLYSMGIVAYELLAGELPFRANNVVQTLLMQLTQPPPSLSEKYGVPEPISRVVLKVLEKNRENRYSSAEEFAQAWRSAMDELHTRKADGAKTTDSSTESLPEPAVSSHGTEIVCLDDNPIMLNILQHILTHAGYQVYIANDCSQLHQFLFNKKVKLLISDVQMPGLPGTKICQMLKKTMADLKIILFSNIPERDLERHSIESKADAWISKNSKPDEWLSRIQEIVRQIPN